MRVERRDQLHPDVIQEVSNEFFNLVERGSGKVQTALELCAAHLSENSVKTRFLLLVMAIEVLTTATSKHPAALALLEKWHEDLNSERQKYEASAPERTALDALERELMFRREDSIRSQVRRLLVRVAASDPVRFGDLPTRGVKIYDKRSVLVHDGTLSESELSQLEVEAREIVQAALRHSLAELQTIGPG